MWEFRQSQLPSKFNHDKNVSITCVVSTNLGIESMLELRFWEDRTLTCILEALNTREMWLEGLVNRTISAHQNCLFSHFRLIYGTFNPSVVHRSLQN